MQFDFGQHTPAAVPCCLCGTAVSPPNPSNMCVTCIRSQVDITEGIPKQLTCHWCKGCSRFFEPPNRWMPAALESKELLAYCLRRMKQLNKVKLIDASFVWTEPHSKRIKLKLTIQKEVFTSTILQQVFVVEFVVANLFCPDCHKVEAGTEHTWVAVAQCRQKVTHKRTFFWLEQLILRHGAHQQTLSIKEEAEGLDFYFVNQAHAARFVDFLQSVVPLRYKTARKLVNHDAHNNVFSYKHTFSIELPPICKDDVICLPPEVSRQFGHLAPVLLCHKVSNLLHFIDPFTLQTFEMNSNTYWYAPFRALVSKAMMIEFVVLDSEPVGNVNGKMVLSEVTIARNSDFGRNDRQFITRTHLGAVLNPGDTVLGYDLSTANVNDADLVGLKGGVHGLPEIILVRKSYPTRRRKSKNRIWKLKTLAKEQEEMRRAQANQMAHDYEDFLQELEEDPEMRGQIQLFKTDATAVQALQAQPAAAAANGDDMDDDEADFPDINVDELLDDVAHLSLNDN